MNPHGNGSQEVPTPYAVWNLEADWWLVDWKCEPGHLAGTKHE